MNSIQDYKNFVNLITKYDENYGPYIYSKLDITFISGHFLFTNELENINNSQFDNDILMIQSFQYKKDKILEIERINKNSKISSEKNIDIFRKLNIDVSELDLLKEEIEINYNILKKSLSTIMNKIVYFEEYSNFLFEEEELIYLENKLNYEENLDYEKNPNIAIKNFLNSIINFEKKVESSLVHLLKRDLLSEASKVEKIFKSNLLEGSISNFLKDKIISDNISAEFSFSQNEQIKRIYLFNDDSILLQDKNNDIRFILNNTDLLEVVENLHINLTNYNLRKKPTLAKLFNQKIKEEMPTFRKNLAISHLENINIYQENEQILKNNNFTINRLNELSIEVFGDKISHIITKHKINQYRKSITSNKYEHFLNDDNYKDFKTLYELNVTKEELQKYVGKKIASCKEQSSFDTILKDLIKIVNSFEYNIVLNNLEKYNIKPFYDKEGVIAFEVLKYEECKKFGSPSWCIQRSESTFYDYKDNCHQVIVYDFNKELSDSESMIGFTIYNDGSQRTQHLKDDSHFNLSKNNLINEIYIESLKKITNKSLLREDLNILINKEKNKIKLGV